MKIIGYIFENWSDITLVFLVLFVIIYSLFTNRLEYLKAEIFSLVTEAEKLYGGKTGEMKMVYVIKKIYSKMPAILKTFLSENQLKKIIENVLMKAKEWWSNSRIIEGSEEACL